MKQLVRQGATKIWISVTISTILSTCEESKTDKVIGLIYVWTIMRRVNDIHHQWWNTRNNTFRNARYRLRKISASISIKQSEHKHVSKSQGAAELCVQLIMSIYEVLNAKGDITQGYLRWRDRDVLWIELVLWGCRKWFDKLWIVVGRKITEPNYRTRNSSQC